MPNTSKPSSSSKGDKASKPVKKRQKSSKTSAKETGSKSTDRCEPLATSSAKEINTEGEHWYELLEEKIGLDINAKEWMKKHPELASKNKSELLIRLAYELCLAKNTEYDPKKEDEEEQNNKYAKFDTRRIFALFEVANELIDLSDRKNFVEFVCQKGNVQLLKMICKQDSKAYNCVEGQYQWQGAFTGYSKLIDLLQYVIDNRCSPEIVLCVAEKMYGYSHIFYNGKQYLSNREAVGMEKNFKYKISVVEGLLKQVIKLGYKDTVSVMLSGDIYHSIRLMKWRKFQEKSEFLAAYDMVKETVADVISSWVENKQSCKDDLRRLLDQGIGTDLHKIDKESLMLQLGYLGKEVKCKEKTSKEKLVKELEELGEEKGKVRLRQTVVGTFISTLFFRYQDQVMKGRLFALEIKRHDNGHKRKIIDQLNTKIDNIESIEDIVLGLVKLLNSANHVTNNRFFREVLVKVVNENFGKLKAVCAAICKEPMEELLKDEEVHENVIDVLQFFGVEVLPIQIVRSEIPSSSASIADQFMKDINVYSEKEAKVDCSSDELAFSGLTRKIICELEEKKDLTDKEDLISKALSEIKKGINILADETAVKIDVKDIFLSFELVNSKIEKEQKREIVELVCQKGNVPLLEMICKQESSKGNNFMKWQYKWQETFTGYSKLIDLLQYVIDNRCSPEIVLCVAKKMYGYSHIFYSGGQHISKLEAVYMKRNFSYQDSVVKKLFKEVIKLGYKSAASVMLSGDIYHSIRLIKWKVFQEKQEFLAAYDMVKETVADVISSWVKDKQYYKDSVQNLLDQGIEIDFHKMGKEDLIFQLEYLEKKVMSKTHISKKELVQELKELGKEKGEVRVRSIVVGALISTLFFKHQDNLRKGELFILKIKQQDNSKREKILNKLNEKISNEESIKDIVLELIRLLNSSNHLVSGWFFREVLAKVVNEKLDKLKAVCAAICKEPMQELLKGEKVHKNVIDVLQFFGVEKDFLLEKSIPGNSDDALVRNSQGVEETLSNRSEKSISSSSRQSSADHDPQSSTVPISQGGKSIPSAASKKSCSASNLPSSRVAEKNNEGVMQNNCVQGGNPCYSINTGREFYYLNVRNSSMGVRMEKSQQGGILNKIRSKQRESLRKKSSDDRLPKVSYLEDAHCERYRKAFLNKVFNYNKFIDSSMLSVEGQNTEMDRSSLNNSSSTSLDISSVSINDSRDESREDDPYLDGMQDYITGLDLLKEGDESRAKNKIRESAVKGFECGMYAYAIIKFKEAMEGNITTNMLGVNCAPQEVVKEAVECMVKLGRSFSPLNSFILGIMELYNVGNYCKEIQHTSQKSWKMHFADVLRSTKNTPFIGPIAKHNLLACVGAANLDFTDSSDYLEMVGKEKGMKELESMIDHVEYELAKDMVSNKTDLVTAGYLFRQLSSKSFSDAQYSYAVALFNGRLDQREVKKEQKVHDLLSKAASCKHPEAMLLLGILLFKKGYEFVRSNNYWSYLEDFINVMHDDKSLKQNYLKEKVSIFVAYEYINKSNPYVQYDEQKARGILQNNCDKNQLEKLEKAIEKGKECSQNLLSDVLQTLKYVVSVLQTKGSDKLYAQKLPSMLEQLRRNLKDSKITIQQSQSLSFVLQQLNNISSPNEKDLLSLQQLYYNLEEEVEKQLDGSSQAEMLSLIAELSKVSIDVQRRRSSSLSSTNTTKSISTRRGSAAETLQLQSLDESTSDVFEYPSTPSSKVKEITIPSNSNQALLSRPRAASTAVNFEDDSELGPFVNASEFFNTDSDTSTALNSRGSRMFESSRRLSLFVHDIPDNGKLLGQCFNLAAELCEKGEYKGALETYGEVFDRRESVLGYNHHGTIMARHNMAVLLYTIDESQQALGIFKEMLNKLGPSHHYAASIKHNIDVVSKKQGKELFIQPGEKQREPSSKSVSNNFQNVPIVDKGKSSYGSSLSSSSGFENDLSAFSEQSISEGGKIAKLPSSVSGRTEQKQSSGSSQQNVSAAAGLGNGSRRVERLSSFSSTQGRSTSEFSRSSSRTSKSVSDEFSATDISKCTSKGQKVKNKSSDMPPSRSSSRPSSSLDNLETEKHTASSRSIGKR
ncbi:MAG: tetratricopeptide repeat protein [Wolbachia sp.]